MKNCRLYKGSFLTDGQFRGAKFQSLFNLIGIIYDKLTIEDGILFNYTKFLFLEVSGVSTLIAFMLVTKGSTNHWRK